MQLFSGDAIVFSKPQNMKKQPSKVAHNRPPTFFLCTGRAAQMAQKQKSRTVKSPLMQDWVFRWELIFLVLIKNFIYPELIKTRYCSGFHWQLNHFMFLRISFQNCVGTSFFVDISHR